MFVADSVGILCRHCKRNTGLGGKLFMKNMFVGYTKWKRKGYTKNRNSSLANLKLVPDPQMLTTPGSQPGITDQVPLTHSGFVCEFSL